MANGKRSKASDNTSDKPISDVVGLVASRPKVDWETAARMFLEEGLNCGEIGARLGYSKKHVRSQLAKLGLTRRSLRTPNDPREVLIHRVWRKILEDCKPSSASSALSRFTPRLCDEWQHFPRFRDWAIAFGFGAGMAVRRIDSGMDFSPDTCQVVSIAERIGTRKIVAFGETKSLAAWSQDPRCSITRSGLARRLAKGIPPEEAITGPLDPSDEATRAKRATGSWVSQVDWQRARKLYEIDGLSASAVARELGFHSETILEGLKARGVTIRPGRGEPITRESLSLRATWKRMRTNSEQFAAAAGSPPADAVEPNWRNFEDFASWARSTAWEPGRCLGRLDKTQSFTPDNCRWMTRSELTASRRVPQKSRKSIVLITAFGETKGITDWSRDPRCRINASTLKRRLLGGLHPEDAITRKGQNKSRQGVYTGFLEAFGERKSYIEWIVDPRCRVSMTTLKVRVASKWNAEKAISTPPFGKAEGQGPIGLNGLPASDEGELPAERH